MTGDTPLPLSGTILSSQHQSCGPDMSSGNTRMLLCQKATKLELPLCSRHRLWSIGALSMRSLQVSAFPLSQCALRAPDTYEPRSSSRSRDHSVDLGGRGLLRTQGSWRAAGEMNWWSRTRTHYVAQDSFELETLLLLQSPKHWGGSCEPLLAAYCISLEFLILVEEKKNSMTSNQLA